MMEARRPLVMVSCTEPKCGVCCGHLNVPPFMDYEWPFVPGELIAEIEEHQKSAAYNHGRDQPCLWLDGETGRCKHYEDRPDVCEFFEVGGEDCLRFRREAGVDAP